MSIPVWDGALSRLAGVHPSLGWICFIPDWDGNVVMLPGFHPSLG